MYPPQPPPPPYGPPAYGQAPYDPYAPPTAPYAPSLYGAPMGQAPGAWRAGDVLVFHRQTRLPDRCLKTGAPATLRLRKKLQWYPQWVGFLVLFSPLIFAIVALVVMKRAQVELPLCDAAKKRRTTGLLVGWLGSVASIGLIAAGGATEVVPLILLGLLAMLGCIIAGAILATLVRPVKIDEQYVCVRGVHESVLAELPAGVLP